MKIFILVLFILTYLLIICLPKFKVYITGATAVIASTACLIAGNLTFGGLFGAIDYNVVLMLLGIMVTVGLFTESGMPNKLSDKLISKIPNVMVAVVLLAFLSGIVSAFIDNVATVLMLAPIGLAVAKKAKISPIPVIISIAVSSNLQGAATLVGDTTSIMLGGFANMNFFEFFFLNGKFSIFWAVELGALLTIPVLFFIFRKENKKMEYLAEDIKVTTVVPTILLLLNIVLLIVFSFLPFDIVIGGQILTNGIICMGFAIIGVVFYIVKFKANSIKDIGKAIDYETILFLTFLFIIIANVECVGIINDIGKFFISIGSENVFLLYTLIVFGSVLISAFIDNIPYVATMLPVIQVLCAGLPGVSPYLLYFGLLIGATLGGNITPVGASANVVGIGILRKEGYEVKLKDFLKIGLPFTLVAVLGGYLFCWFIWA